MLQIPLLALQCYWAIKITRYGDINGRARTETQAQIMVIIPAIYFVASNLLLSEGFSLEYLFALGLYLVISGRQSRFDRSVRHELINSFEKRITELQEEKHLILNQVDDAIVILSEKPTERKLSEVIFAN